MEPVLGVLFKVSLINLLKAEDTINIQNSDK